MHSLGVSVPFTANLIANQVLSCLDIERILSQKLSSKRDEIKKVFQILDPNHKQTVTKAELKRTITTFLMPLTKDQFQDLLAQVGGATLGMDCSGKAGELAEERVACSVFSSLPPMSNQSLVHREFTELWPVWMAWSAFVCSC